MISILASLFLEHSVETTSEAAYNTSMIAVAAPGRQGSQVISSHQGREAGHQVKRSKGARSFRGQKILKPGHRISRPQNTGRQRR